MILLIYGLAVILFCLSFYYTHLAKTCSEIVTIAKEAVTTVSDRSLDDAAKEKATQDAAINMLKNSFVLLFKIFITFALTLLPIWLADIAELADFDATSKFALRIDVLVITTIVAMATVFIWRKLLKNKR